MPDLVILCEKGQPKATATWGSKVFSCMVGKHGPVLAANKREGDGCTPLGRMEMLYGFYRADRLEKPAGSLPWRALQPEDRWCEKRGDPLYNQLVPVDYPERVEGDGMWKDDNRFDIAVVLNHNMPPEDGNGAGIFLHIAREGVETSLGCVLLVEADLRQIAEEFAKGDAVEVKMA